MRIDFGGISVLLQRRLAILRLRVRRAILNLLRRIVVKLGSEESDEQFAALSKVNDEETVEKLKYQHRQAVFASVGLALSRWAQMEELLVVIASVLLRTHEAKKVGMIFYSIANFPTWLSIVGQLFSQEPRYASLKPRWNKISERLRELNDTRVRLAHHAVDYADEATILAGGTSLKLGEFDIRPKSEKHRVEPLTFVQIQKFMLSVNKVTADQSLLLTTMTDIMDQEISKQNSSEQSP
jgi:hypothetical protein